MRGAGGNLLAIKKANKNSKKPTRNYKTKIKWKNICNNYTSI